MSDQYLVNIVNEQIIHPYVLMANGTSDDFYETVCKTISAKIYKNSVEISINTETVYVIEHTYLSVDGSFNFKLSYLRERIIKGLLRKNTKSSVAIANNLSENKFDILNLVNTLNMHPLFLESKFKIVSSMSFVENDSCSYIVSENVNGKKEYSLFYRGRSIYTFKTLDDIQNCNSIINPIMIALIDGDITRLNSEICNKNKLKDLLK